MDTDVSTSSDNSSSDSEDEIEGFYSEDGIEGFYSEDEIEGFYLSDSNDEVDEVLDIVPAVTMFL